MDRRRATYMQLKVCFFLSIFTLKQETKVTQTATERGLRGDYMLIIMEILHRQNGCSAELSLAHYMLWMDIHCIPLVC